MMKMQICLFAGLLAGAVSAETVNLNVTGEKTFAAALESAGYAWTDLAGTLREGDIRIDGNGTVVFERSAEDFAGCLRIGSGVTASFVCSNAMGGVSSRAYIESGATYHARSGVDGNGDPLFAGTLYFEGTGVDGKGGVRLDSLSGSGSTWLMGQSPTLTGDATLYLASGRFNAGSSVRRMTLDLGGHTLTATSSDARMLCLNCTIMKGADAEGRGGCLIANKVDLFLQGYPRFVGGAENTLVLRTSGTRFRFNEWGNSSSVETQPALGAWTLKVEEGPIELMAYACKSTATNYLGWAGPVQLDAKLKVTRDTSLVQTTPVPIRLYGKVSGTGAVEVVSSNIKLNLLNGENAFTGGITLDGGSILDATQRGSLPTNCPLQLENGSNVLMPEMDYTQSAASLASLTVVGAGAVTNGLGSISGTLVKDGTGTLDYYSGVGASVLDVRGGTVNLSYGFQGLQEGRHTYESGVGAAFDDCVVFTNRIAGGTEMAYCHGAATGWTKGTFVSYQGYIWNRTASAQQWTFAESVWQGCKLFLDGQQVVKGFQNSSARIGNKKTVEVKPGAHLFQAWLYSTATSTSSGGAYGGITNFAWKADFGLVYDPTGQDSTNCVDYVKLLNADGNLLFTVSTNEANMMAVFDTMRFAPGTGLNLAGGTYGVPHLEGLPSVEAGSLTVTADWKLSLKSLVSSGSTLDVAAGALTFNPAATLVLDASGQKPVKGDLVIASAAGGIVGCPTLVTDRPGFSLKQSTDGKSLILTYTPQGMAVIFR